jgi:hypothetical protein
MSIPREGSRDTGQGIIISLSPDVCKTPVGSALVPIPYTITAIQGDDANTVATVRMTGQRAHNMASLVTQGSGDAPGTGMGVVSGTVGSVCHPKSHSGSVRIRGEWAIRHNDEWWMNNRNTLGKLTYVRDTSLFGETPAVVLYRERPEAEILLAELELPGTETVTDFPPILDVGIPPAVPGEEALPPSPLPSEGIPTPDNPPPSVTWRWLGRIAQSPAIAM